MSNTQNNKKHTARCPKCGNTESFVVTAHVTQTWEVDAEGNFIAELNSCDEVLHHPDEYDVWICNHCGAEAIFDKAK